MPRYEIQRATREQEVSKLTITGVDINAKEFQEDSEIIDISDTGITFLLKTTVWMDAHLTIQIHSSSLFGPSSVQKAKVVRFGKEINGRRFVGARFD